MTTTTRSIYIPRVSRYHTEDSIRNVMMHYNMGTVTHVDFTPINKSKGFQGVVEPGAFRSAFVHFLTLHPTMHPIWEAIEKEVPYQLTVNEREYWICLKNKNPVPRTHMNIHQVVDNCAYLEKLILAQAAEIKAQAAEIEELKRQVFVKIEYSDDDDSDDDEEIKE